MAFDLSNGSITIIMFLYNELGRVPFYFILCKSLCKIDVIFLSTFGKKKKITGGTIRP